MDLTKPSELKPLLARHGLQLSKRFGQNFLVDRTHLMRVVEAAQITDEDGVFEIGPEVGTLTLELAPRAKHVVSVELDRSVFPVLSEVMAPFPNVTLVQGDALRLDLPTVLPEAWGQATGKVVANIPYNITSPVLVRLLENRSLFRSITLMVQKEVADRLRAAPDTENYGSLTVFTKFYADVRMVSAVPRGAFFPPPKVDSAIVHLTPHAALPVEVPSEAAFLAVSRAAFGQRRKTLQNALTNADGLAYDRDQIIAALQSAGIDGQRRGETLTLDEIAAISRELEERPDRPEDPKTGRAEDEEEDCT